MDGIRVILERAYGIQSMEHTASAVSFAVWLFRRLEKE